MKVIDEKAAKQTFDVAIVVSRFNTPITSKLLEGAVERLKEKDFTDDQITVVWVPGAIEIPLAAQRLAEMGRSQAIIVLGAVIQGETDHYQYVCESVTSGCQQVALQHDMPVIFGVLTTQNEALALDRIGGAHGHKGKDCVDAAVEMVATLSKLD